MTRWFDLSSNANKLKQTYFKGFLDISGGGIHIRSDASINFYDNTGSDIPKFSIKSDSMRIQDQSGNYYNVDTEKLIYIKDLTKNVKTQIDDVVTRTKYITSDIRDNDTMIELDGSSNKIKLYSNIIPALPNIYNLGSIDTPFGSIYVSENTINGNLFVLKDVSLNGNVNIGGILTSITQLSSDNSTKVATTEFVKNQNYAPKDGAVLTGTTIMQNASISQKLLVTGDASFNSKLFVYSSANLNNKLLVTGDTSLNSKLFVSGDALLNGNVSISGNLTTITQVNSDNSTKVATTAFVKNQDYAQLTGANFTGDLSLNARLYVVNDASFNKSVFINGDTSLNGNLNVDGIVTVPTQTTSDNSKRVATTAFVKNQGYATLESPSFTGTTIIPIGNITTLTVNNATTLNGNAYTVTQSTNDNSTKIATTEFVKNQGYATLESPSFTGTVNTSNITISSKLLASGDASLNGKLFVSGDASMNGNVKINGSLTTSTPSNNDNSLKVATTAFVKNQGYAQLSGANFTGDLTTNSKLLVSGDTSMNGNLYVNGYAVLSGDTTTITQTTSDNSTKLATTEFVKKQGYSTLSSPQFTGIPIAPTAQVGTTSTQIATTEYVRTEIISFINTIPDALDAIQQLSAALSSTDASFTTSLATSLGLKADKESPTFTGTVILPITNVMDDIYIHGETTLNQNLFVAGDASFNGLLNASTPSLVDNSTKVATTAYVKNQEYAQLSGANFTGVVGISSKLNITDDVSMNSKLSIGNDVSMNGKLYVNGKTTMNEDVIMNNKLLVQNDVSMNGGLFVNGNINTTTPITTDNSTKVATTEFVKNQNYANLSGANFTGDVSFNSKMLVLDDVTMNTKLIVKGDISANSRLFIGSDASLNGKLFVNGEVSMNANVSINGNLISNTPNISENSNLVATTAFVKNQNYAPLNNPNFTGTTNASSIVVSGNLDVYSNINISNNLNVNGNTLIGGNLSVTGLINTPTPLTSDNSTTVATTAFVKSQPFAPLDTPTFTGKTTTDILVVSGDASFNGNLLAKTQVTSDNSSKVATTEFVKNQPFAPLDTPTFTGKTTTDKIDILGNITVLGDASLNGNLYIGKTVYENGVSLTSKYATINSPSFIGEVSGISKSMVGLGNADNTSDINKPISTATQNVLNLKANIASPSLTGTTNVENINISQNLILLGDASINGSVIINGYASAETPSNNENSKILATTSYVKNQGYASLSGSHFTGDVIIDSKLQVSNDVSFNSKLTIAGDVSLNGSVTAITRLTTDNSKHVATTEYVKNQGFATLQSPSFTGVPTAPTLSSNVVATNQIATAQYVVNKISESFSLASVETLNAINNISQAFSQSGSELSASIASQLDSKADKASPTFTGLVSLPQTTISDNLSIGGDLSMNGDLNVSGYIFERGTRLSSLYAPILSPSFTGEVSGISKSMVGLSNVDNTSDINKPISTDTQNALDLKANIASPSFTGRSIFNGNVIINQNATIGGNTVIVGDMRVSKSIYENGVLLNTVYAKLESPTFTGNVSGITKSMVDLSNVDNTSDINKPISTSTQNALNLKANLISPSFIGNVNISDKLSVLNDVSINGNLFVLGDISLNGNIRGVTQNSNDNSTKLATTAFVKNQNQSYASLTGANFTGDISLNTRLFVGGDVSLNSKLFVGKDVLTNGNLYVLSDIYEKGATLTSIYSKIETPTFSGTATFDRVDVTVELIVNSDTTMNGKLNVTGDVSMNSSISVNGDIYEKGVSLTNKYATLNSPTFNGTVGGITKYMIDLSNVDNTSDINKPVSTATQTVLNLKANIVSPTFTGTPLAPTASSGTNTTQVATTAYVQGEINTILGVSPQTGLNTLAGIASAINNDTTFANTISSQLALKANIASPSFTGLVTLPSVSITNDTSMNGNLHIVGLTVIDKDVSMNGNLYIQGDLSLNGRLYANYGDGSIPSSAIKNLRNEYGEFYINCQRSDIVTFDDEGFETSISSGFAGYVETIYSQYSDLSLNGNLYINGNGVSVFETDSTLNGNLYVNKKAFLEEEVTINNNLDLSGSLIAHNNVNVYGIINQYTTTLEQGYIVNYASSETTIADLQSQITTLQGQLTNILQILSRNNIN